MVEYGVKKIVTNPTIMTKASEIIKVVDYRNNQTKAFILPASYAPLIEKLEKEREYKEWVKSKKEALKKAKNSDDKLEDIMNAGLSSTKKYLS